MPEGEWYCTQCTCESVTIENESHKETKDNTDNNNNIDTNDHNDDNDNNDSDNYDTHYKHPDNQIIAGLKADFHMMRRERNRILFQWQNEKKIASVLEKQRQDNDRERDIGIYYVLLLLS